MTFKTVRVLPANSGAFRTINILSAGDGNNEVSEWQETTMDDRTFETVQDSGGLVAGMKHVNLHGHSSGYKAKAVTFDPNGNTYFDILSLTAADNQFFSGIIWFNLDLGGGTGGGQVIQVDPNGGFTSRVKLGPGAGDTLVDLIDTTGNNDVERVIQSTVSSPAWHSLLWSGDTLNQILKVYLDDVEAGNLVVDGVPFSMAFNGLEFSLWQDGENAPGGGYLGNGSDCWIAPGQSLLTAGDISLVTRRKFVTAANKPVDLGAHGELPTGISPAIFFSGNKDTYGQPNLGTGGAFTLTGTLTNASTSPSD